MEANILINIDNPIIQTSDFISLVAFSNSSISEISVIFNFTGILFYLKNIVI